MPANYAAGEHCPYERHVSKPALVRHMGDVSVPQLIEAIGSCLQIGSTPQLSLRWPLNDTITSGGAAMPARRPSKIRRCLRQDLVGPLQLSILSLQLLESLNRRRRIHRQSTNSESLGPAPTVGVGSILSILESWQWRHWNHGPNELSARLSLTLPEIPLSPKFHRHPKSQVAYSGPTLINLKRK